MFTYNVNVEVLENVHTLHVASKSLSGVICTCISYMPELDNCGQY